MAATNEEEGKVKNGARMVSLVLSREAAVAGTLAVTASTSPSWLNPPMLCHKIISWPVTFPNIHVGRLWCHDRRRGIILSVVGIVVGKCNISHSSSHSSSHSKYNCIRKGGDNDDGSSVLPRRAKTESGEDFRKSLSGGSSKLFASHDIQMVKKGGDAEAQNKIINPAKLRI